MNAYNVFPIFPHNWFRALSRMSFSFLQGEGLAEAMNLVCCRLTTLSCSPCVKGTAMPSKRSVRIPFPKNGDDSDDDAGEIVAPGKQCLPMASLPGNFSGEPGNGEEYLAMMQ